MDNELRALLVVQNASVGRILFDELTKRRIDFDLRHNHEEGEKGIGFLVIPDNLMQMVEVTEAMKSASAKL